LTDPFSDAAQPKRLFADAGYDAEWIHVECRESWVWKVSFQRLNGEPTANWWKMALQDEAKSSEEGGLWSTLGR
jgi:hypothetical protein